MTQPEPTPGAPAVDPTPPPVVPAPEVTPFDPSSLPPEVKAYLKAQVDAADLKARTTSKANAAKEAEAATMARVAKALGIAAEGEELDPSRLNEHLEQAQAAAWRSGVELSILRVAPRLGADAEALLDSNAFLDTLDDLVDEDPRGADFSTALEAKVQEALEKHPNKYRANGQAPAAPTAPRPDPSQGPRSGSPTPVGRTLTDAIRAHYTK